MKICVIGWYGTETVGDRAILDGILQIYGKMESTITCSIGSLYPFFTERTLLMDRTIYESNAKRCELICFDVKQKDMLKQEILTCDCVLMGGGPLMDLFELKVVEFAFQYAKKMHKQTIIFGCGVGPLNLKAYQRIVRKIFQFSDIIILRDKESEQLTYKLYGDSFRKKTCAICDPAIFSILKYKNKNELISQCKKEISINFRNVTSEYSNQHHTELFMGIIRWAGKNFEKIKLVPMHTFSIGGDDRDVFAEIISQNSHGNIEPMYLPLNLYETYNMFASSYACIGMRYHSVVMQVLLNGNNLILDYTKKKTGKISGFLSQIDENGFYSNNRLINIVDNHEIEFEQYLESLTQGTCFSADVEIYNKCMDQYIKILKQNDRDNR